MVNNKMNNLDNKKVKMKQFKFNFIFDDKGENFEKLAERAFSNYCITRLEKKT